MDLSFNSLQTGKCIQSTLPNTNVFMNTGMFQFPSNGKVYSKEKFDFLTPEELEFQFPSNGKVYSKVLKMRQALLAAWFQFPSNGKVYSKDKENLVVSP